MDFPSGVLSMIKVTDSMIAVELKNRNQHEVMHRRGKAQHNLDIPIKTVCSDFI